MFWILKRTFSMSLSTHYICFGLEIRKLFSNYVSTVIQRPEFTCTVIQRPEFTLSLFLLVALLLTADNIANNLVTDQT